MSDPNNSSSSAAASQPFTPDEDKKWASFAHLGNIVMLIPALVIYLVFKDRGPMVKEESKEALNWTINITGIYVILNVLSVFIPFVGFLSYLFLLANLLFAILGFLKAKDGGSYKYPVNIRWIK